MTRESMRLRNVLEGFSKIFHLGAFVTKNLKIEWCQTGTSLQPRAHIAVRCCLLYVVQGPRSFLALVIFCQCAVLELQSIKVLLFSHFCLYFLTQNAQKYLFVPGLYTAQGLHCRMLQVIPFLVEGPKGCLFLVVFSCNA